jgi:protein-disulfide isomerase-like protein with CxxC motif
MERFWKVLSLTLIVGIVAVVSVGMVFAQDDTPEPPYDGEGLGSWKWGHGRGGRGGFPGIDREEVKTRLAGVLGMTLEEFDAAISDGETLASLAEANGVSFEELREVMDELFDEALATAVQDGNITQEQADQILEGRAVKHAVSDAIDRDEVHAALAEALGLTVEEFEAAISSGERLSTLAEGADVTLEELHDIMQGFKAEAIAQAVADGTITQEQADEMLERMELRGEGCGGKFGGHGDHGFRGDGTFGGPEGRGFPGGGFGKGGGFGIFSSSGGA